MVFDRPFAIMLSQGEVLGVKARGSMAPADHVNWRPRGVLDAGQNPDATMTFLENTEKDIP